MPSYGDAGTNTVRIEVFTGAGQRREWEDETNACILAASYAGFKLRRRDATGHVRRSSSSGGRRRAKRWRRPRRYSCRTDPDLVTYGVRAETANRVQLVW
jgi:hypothetical protein